MGRTIRFTISRRRQPKPEAWQAALDLATRWNATSPAFPLESSFGSSLLTHEVPPDHPEASSLRQAFDELQTRGVVTSIVVLDHVDGEDLSVADFVDTIGVGIADTPDRPFISGGGLEALDPCPRCGASFGWRWRQRAPFVIDESQLRSVAATLDGDRAPGPDGWDIVNLPNGGVGVSRRIVEVLRESGLGGWSERPMLSAATREPSTKMVQLEATMMVTMPCPQHDDNEAKEVCPVCGVVLKGRLEMGWHVQRALIDGLALFSRGPTLNNSLYLRRTLYDRMRERGYDGLIPLHTARICDHAPPAATAS